jgi:IS5 family transposase
LQRKLPTHSLFETYQKDFLFSQQVLAQQPKDKNKIYSLHEPDVCVIAKALFNMAEVTNAKAAVLHYPKTSDNFLKFLL